MHGADQFVAVDLTENPEIGEPVGADPLHEPVTDENVTIVSAAARGA